ncbi:unnamed protein product [Allacma fusca]|uniref:Uncharacterized protein n=1 Tax=Allacma fusca TaxID=39272 RepID=A0A8J2KVN2_9HEXA|nr:unnamed protein product [Allacma fusca]
MGITPKINNIPIPNIPSDKRKSDILQELDVLPRASEFRKFPLPTKAPSARVPKTSRDFLKDFKFQGLLANVFTLCSKSLDNALDVQALIN